MKFLNHTKPKYLNKERSNESNQKKPTWNKCKLLHLAPKTPAVQVQNG